MRLSSHAVRSPSGILSRTIRSAVLLVLISLGAIQVLAQVVAPSSMRPEVRVARNGADPETTGSIASAARGTVFNPCLVGLGRTEPR